MDRTYIHHNYEINSFSWDSLSDSGKQQFSAMVKSNQANASKFCALYFNRFDLLHKLGHIFIDCFGSENKLSSLDIDHFANLFAFKYLQYKKENEYLSLLDKWICILLKLYNIPLNLHENINEVSFEKYKANIVSYAAMHYCCIHQCMADNRSFEELLRSFTGKHFNALNKGIVFRKGINGSELLYECVFSIFETNYAYPEVTIHYPEEITLDNIDWIGKSG